MKRLRKNNMNFARKVWVLMKPFHRQLYLILAVTTLFETVRMGGPYIFGRILDLLIKTQGLISFQTALAVVIGLAGVRLVSLIIESGAKPHLDYSSNP